ncbi:MAG: hypothetical protein GY799_21670 [Desulfobulbaceae bacterium]|nr:hypothetical protein [Desulfobulbaceae bacterium]
MPLNIPNLDDRRFTDLVEEALSMLPRYAPNWTNHNPSDPGITLIELLAYFSEMQIYRLNRISRQSKIKFLQLLREVKDDEKEELAALTTPIKKIDEALDRAVLALRKPQRAVTSEDYEKLVQHTLVATGAGSPIKRVKCFMRTNLAALNKEMREINSPGHISLVVVPDSNQRSETIDALLTKVREDLEEKRLLTTRLHVVEPQYLYLSIGAAIRALPGVNSHDLQRESVKKIEKFFSPLPDPKTNSQGWSFGRSVYLSEVYEQLDKIDGVDFVEDIQVLRLSISGETQKSGNVALGVQIGVPSAATVGENTRIGCVMEAGEKRLVRDKYGRLISIKLRPYELVKVTIHNDEFLIDPPNRG